VLRYFIYQIPDIIPYLTLLFALSGLTSLLGSCCELIAFEIEGGGDDESSSSSSSHRNKYNFNTQYSTSTAGSEPHQAADEESPLVG
jgi:hypothetical protein